MDVRVNLIKESEKDKVRIKYVFSDNLYHKIVAWRQDEIGIAGIVGYINSAPTIDAIEWRAVKAWVNDDNIRYQDLINFSVWGVDNIAPLSKYGDVDNIPDNISYDEIEYESDIKKRIHDFYQM